MLVRGDHSIQAYALVPHGETAINLNLLFDSAPAAWRASDEYQRVHSKRPSIVEVEVSASVLRVLQMGERHG